MNRQKQKKTTPIPVKLIAPCGMNCRLCWGYIRENNTCPGCRNIAGKDSLKSKYRHTCIIKNCRHMAEPGIRYCSGRCDRYPCTRLKNLDKRYRMKYGMSMIDNLEMIHAFGIKYFIRNEKEKWTCPECGELICVHRPACLLCGYQWRLDRAVTTVMHL